jgi:hypothetical protein
MPSAGFESATPATKRPQTYASDREVTGIGGCSNSNWYLPESLTDHMNDGIHILEKSDSLPGIERGTERSSTTFELNSIYGNVWLVETCDMKIQYTDQEMIPARNARNVVTLAEVINVKTFSPQRLLIN